MFTCVNLVSLPLNFLVIFLYQYVNVYVAEANKEYFGDDEDCQDGEEINSKQLFKH